MSIWSTPGLKQVRQSAFLNTRFRIGYGAYWGCFPSRSAAESFLSKPKRATYDSDRVVTINLETFQAVHPFDWPVMFFLQRFHQERQLKVVTDFGGHVGVKYHAYRNAMPLPPGIAWQVVDVPAICREGRRRIRPDDAGLSYHESLDTAADCDVLLCSGSLQYSDRFVDQIVADMRTAPRMIIINKVSVSDQDFYTLESFDRERMPHRVVTDGYLTKVREGLGYEKLNQWDIPGRRFKVPHQTGELRAGMIGQAWIRA
ncbi:hypothetical protein ASF49_14325 [Methylobacterium sp. Leaf104]|uniref:methyltransferase, TIGR04325 family n=1 Tax=Methylobacterium TaxID=407 RepID=UPI0006FC8447|nr:MULTISPECIES: methyltransferase, TIGR04325 family [Methylobacterium]KQP29856.1 hypothetical protein ASF49_14325 [Methylobacterium sp. Leaf104]MCI9882455.1 methyltransferase, TIGR04325 family [Methylobacterium goesingense]